MIFGIIFLVILVIALACPIYMLIRNEWVYRKKMQLITWHFHSGECNPRDDFDKKYGSYDDWLYNYFCWNPAKMAGLEKWVTK